MRDASNGVPVEFWSRLAVDLFSSPLPHSPGDALTRPSRAPASGGLGRRIVELPHLEIAAFRQQGPGDASELASAMASLL